MISKEKVKFIRSLHTKKGREETGFFLVEGEKSIQEVLVSKFETRDIFISADFYKKNKNLLEGKNYTITSKEYIEKVSTLMSNDMGVVVAKSAKEEQFNADNDEIILVLDGIHDPGNLGSTIRTADWYGIKKIVCSNDTVEAYNPKVIISSMGSFTRVHIFYTDLESFLKDKKNVYGAFLEGQDIHKLTCLSIGVKYLVMGSESHGIRANIYKYIGEKITIPRFGNSDSLNVGVATGIIIDNLKRILKK